MRNVDIAADDIAALVEFAQPRAHRPHDRRARSAARHRRDRRLRSRGPALLRPAQAGRAPRRLQGLHQGIPAAATAFRRRPTRRSRRRTFDAAWVRAQRAPLVVKADGLAAGKGVVICETTEEAISSRAGHVRRPVRRRRQHGRDRRIPARRGSELHRHGRRHEHILPLATSQDHKRRDDGDRGPNTGGMGAYSPAPVVTDEMHRRIMREVMQPTVRGLIADGTPYIGFLYAGIMIAPDGTPNVLEFNCRFGDPETQPIMMRLHSRPDAAVRGGAGRQAGSHRGEVGPARVARRRAGGRRLPGRRAQGR